MSENDVNWELIVHRLDTIAKNQETTSDKLSIIEDKLTKFETMKNSVDDLKSWKNAIQETVSLNELRDIRMWKHKIDEITSPTLLKETLDEVGKLKTFKIQALMIWAIVQAIMVILIFLEKFSVI